MRRALSVVAAALMLACATSPRQATVPAPTTPVTTATPVATAQPAPADAGIEQTDIGIAANPRMTEAVIREGTTRSRVAGDLQFLTDVIGPRLTGSAAMKRANDWTAAKFREYGADSAWLESWKFGRSWERGPMTLSMLAPHRRQLIGFSWAWAPGTPGPLAGDVMLVDARTEVEFAQRFAGKLKGKYVLTSVPLRIWNPDGPAMTSRDSARMDSLKQASVPESTPEAVAYRRKQFVLLAGEGIAGLIRDGGKEFTLVSMSGSPARLSDFPYFVVPGETYRQIHRLLEMHETVRLEANIRNTVSRDSTVVYNTIAEIRGSERPDEVVLLGAHLDSWDLATGTTDNATGSIAVLEAARILRAAGSRPKRTIRFALFSGEEQGLHGSAKYAEAHAADLPRMQAVLVLDNGTGRITGMSLQGRDDLRAAWEALFAPLAPLGPFTVQSRRKGGTDHLSFIKYGVPAFNFDQTQSGYNHTHHSQADTYDHAIPEYIAQAATVMAATALELANAAILIPRVEPSATR